MKNKSPVERAARSAWKPPDIRLPWQWMEDNVEVDRTSPMPGMWRAANSPWVRELTEVVADKTKSFVAVKCSAQSSKTQTILNCLLWSVPEDPGPAMYVMANREDAQDFVRDRFEPSMKACRPVADLLLRTTKLSFTYRTMPLYFVGAGSTGKLQGKPMKRLWLDEVRNYPPGALETVMKRVRAFGKLAQVFLISTPGDAGDAVDQAFQRGDQRTFHFPCPKCSAMQQLRFEQLKAEHPDTHQCVQWEEVPGVCDDGQWNFEALGSAIRFQCVKCGHLISDTPTDRKTICRTGSFIRMNPKAESCDVSFTWNALLPWWVSWASIAKEAILAKAAARQGNIEPMKTFVTETLAESWEDRLGIIEDFGFLETRKAPYSYGEVWSESQRRFMAADKGEKGGEHYWWVVREFGPHGKSRLVGHGKARSLAELEETRKNFSVSPTNAIIDSGFTAQEVYRFCLGSGWKPFKGENRDEYFEYIQTPNVPGGKTMVRRIWKWSPVTVYHATSKLRVATIRLVLFSDFSTQDLMMEYMTGRVGDWTIPDRTEREYLRHIGNERRKEKKDSKGAVTYYYHRYGEQGWRDCEKMILIAAIVSNSLNTQNQNPANNP